jgi:signal transduction histidine kinase
VSIGRRRVAERVLVRIARLAALAGIVAGIYVLVVLGIGHVPTSTQWSLLACSAIAAAICALVYVHLQGPLDAFINRLLRRQHGSADELVRSFGVRTARGLPIDELLLQLAESLRATFSLARAEIWTSSGGILELAASDPPVERGTLILDRAEEAAAARAGVVGRTWLGLWLPDLLEGLGAGPLRVAPIAHAQTFLGLIVIARSEGQEELSEKDHETLSLLARQVGLAVHDISLGSALEASMDELRRQADELRESRARVVAAADAERRRIERDLHDGAQQHLIGLVVNIQVARELAVSDPSGARAVLDELSKNIHAAIEEVRDLARGIYPPLLVDRGLPDAVLAALERAPVHGRIDAAGIGRYAVDLEATVYFCCLEAIQNAGKHAGPGARVSIRIWEEDATLLFEVADDGCGFEPGTHRGGVGLANMRDRVGALGGQLHVATAAGEGTQVVGGVPL